MPVLEPTLRGSASETDVCFRIVHVALEATNRATAYREQTVEIALGSKGVFENGNIGTLTRHAPSYQLVSVRRQVRCKPKPPRRPARPPKAAGFLRKAIECQALLQSGEASSHATSPAGSA